MMDAKVTWKGKMAFDGTVNSGFVVPLDTRLENGGGSSGFSPMELVLVGLAGCTGMDVIDILRKKRQDVTGFEVRVHGAQASDHPHVFTHITVEYVLTGHNIDPAAADRSVELSVTKYCSVQAMLAKTAQVEHKVTILQAA
jgi:putative redox protein